MFYLGIVSQQDVKRGIWLPSYVLCKSKGASLNRSSWRVYRANTNIKAPKVLVRSIIDNDAMIDFLSAYSTRDHIHGSKRYKHENTKKYYPEGALCWFACNEYGESSGWGVFIKSVPDRTVSGKSDGGKRRLEEALEKTYSTNELLSRPFWAVPLIQSGVKPKLWQRCSSGNND